MLPTWFVIFPFILGSCVGSFLNVLIWRLPRGESIAQPPSHCPHCDHRLSVLDLIPLLSFLILRARCRYCSAPVNWRYFWVELATAALWTVLWLQMIAPRPVVDEPSRAVAFLAAALFVSTLIPILLIDIERFHIPDELNAALLIIGLSHAALASGAHSPWGFSEFGRVSLANSLVGATAGVLFWSLVALGGRLLFRKDALGHGDIKMARGIGAMLLMPGALAAFGMAVFLGVLTGLPMLMMRSETPRTDEASEEQDAGLVVGAEPEAAPEGVVSLLIYTAIYLFWIDVMLLFLPKRAQFAFDVRLARFTGDLPKGFEEQRAWEDWNSPTDEDFTPTVTTIPFGPSLVGGALAVVFFGERIAGWYRAYLRWAFSPE